MQRFLGDGGLSDHTLLHLTIPGQGATCTPTTGPCRRHLHGGPLVTGGGRASQMAVAKARQHLRRSSDSHLHQDLVPKGGHGKCCGSCNSERSSQQLTQGEAVELVEHGALDGAAATSGLRCRPSVSQYCDLDRQAATDRAGRNAVRTGMPSRQRLQSATKRGTAEQVQQASRSHHSGGMWYTRPRRCTCMRACGEIVRDLGPQQCRVVTTKPGVSGIGNGEC